MNFYPWIAAIFLASHLGAWHFWTDYQENKDQVAFQSIRNAAQKAVDEANAKSLKAERDGAKVIADLAVKYEQEKDHADSQAKQRIHDLLTSTVRLRVQLAESTSRRLLSDPTGTTSTSDEAMEGTLAPTVAARLESRYSDYNALARQLSLAQAVILNDRVICR